MFSHVSVILFREVPHVTITNDALGSTPPPTPLPWIQDMGPTPPLGYQTYNISPSLCYWPIPHEYWHLLVVTESGWYVSYWNAVLSAIGVILWCFYVITIKCTLHFDVTIMSSYAVALFHFMIFQLVRSFLHLARRKWCRIKDDQFLLEVQTRTLISYFLTFQTT